VIAPPRKVKRVESKERKTPDKLRTVPEPPKSASSAQARDPALPTPPTFLGKVKSFFRSIFK